MSDDWLDFEKFYYKESRLRTLAECRNFDLQNYIKELEEEHYKYKYALEIAFLCGMSLVLNIILIVINCVNHI